MLLHKIKDEDGHFCMAVKLGVYFRENRVLDRGFGVDFGGVCGCECMDVASRGSGGNGGNLV